MEFTENWRVGTVDSIATSFVPSLNAPQPVEQKLLSFKVPTLWTPFTYEVIEEPQKVFKGRDFKPW